MTMRRSIFFGGAVLALAAVACTPPANPGGQKPGGPGTTATTTTTIAPTPTTLPDTKRLYSVGPLDGWGIAKEGAAGEQYIDAVKIVGDNVYAGGIFQHAVRHEAQPNVQVAARSNLMAVSATTGALLPFVANTNGSVNAIASDGRALYIGGDFTMVNGVPRARLAKLNLLTGAVDPKFAPSTGNIVRDMLYTRGKVYVVGDFTALTGVARAHAAALDPTTGAVDPQFKANPDGKVMAIAANTAETKIYLGGLFQHAGGGARVNLAEVDPTTGNVQGPTFKQATDMILDVSVKSDGTKVYGAGGGGLNSAVSWDATTGKRNWATRANGDTQAVQYSNGFVYMGFHDGFGGCDLPTDPGCRLRLLALDPANGQPSPSFMPQSLSYPGVFCLDADGKRLVAGGYFAEMGGLGVKGLSIHPAS
jgi:hypothetical protein